MKRGLSLAPTVMTFLAVRRRIDRAGLAVDAVVRAVAAVAGGEDEEQRLLALDFGCASRVAAS